MSLAHTLDVARSSLSVVSDRAAVVSRNVAHAGDPGSSRKVVRLSTDAGHAPRLTGIARIVSEALRGNVVAATSDAARQEVIVAALDELDAAGRDADGGDLAAARLTALRSALQTYASSPADASIASRVLNAAKDVAGTLRGLALNVSDVRQRADADIVDAVAELNSGLAKLEQLDVAIVSGTRSGLDVTDQLDERDRIIGAIAGQIGLSVHRRPDNGISLYSDSGIALYDGVARHVSVQSGPLLPGQPGGALTIDGIQATGTGSVMKIASGRLAGLFELRDTISVTYGAQLDEIARGAIVLFAESDQSATPTLPDAAGLFRAAGSSLVPTGTALVAGLAASIEVNPSVDPARGGDLLRLRDGGIADPGNPAYVYNRTGTSGFSARIGLLIDALGSDIGVDARASLPASGALPDLAAASAGWLQAQRQSRSEESGYARARLDRSQGALEQSSGVNMDEQLSELMELQRAYQASSKLITTVDAMFNTLLQAIG